MSELYYGTNYLIHYGMPRRSGRYPWGSGKEPYQRTDGTPSKEDLEAESKSFDWKKAAMIGGGIVAAGLVAYGGYTIYKNYNAPSFLDSATGLPLIKKDHSVHDDVKCLNPGLMNNGISYVDAISGSHQNCALNTTAYDLRRRGYDVYPGLSETGFLPNEITKFYKGGRDWTGPGLKKVSDIENWIIRNNPEGARGNLVLFYEQQFGGGGHSIIWEIKNGKLEIRDGQSHIVNQSLEKALKLANVEATKILRTDDLVPDFDKLKKEGLIRTDNNTKFVVDHLAEIGVNLLRDPIVEAEIAGTIYGGYKLNQHLKIKKAEKEKQNESRENNRAVS